MSSSSFGIESTSTSPKNKITKPKQKRQGRKGKGNSYTRVMADRGLLPLTSTGEKCPIRIPPPPPIPFEELMKNIDQMELDLTSFNRLNPDISWKRRSLTISHLPHYDYLHQKEALVASTLRITPDQYLKAKHTLISAAKRYEQKSLPFRKSDAQKHLRIDVNKASKLWEFFTQVEWI